MLADSPLLRSWFCEKPGERRRSVGRIVQLAQKRVRLSADG